MKFRFEGFGVDETEYQVMLADCVESFRNTFQDKLQVGGNEDWSEPLNEYITKIRLIRLMEIMRAGSVAEEY
jgi:hypothetical protein